MACLDCGALIVEDDNLVAEMLGSMLSEHPHIVITATARDLPEARAAIRKRRPDFAVVDIELANGSTGFSVASMLAEHGVPCIFATGAGLGSPMPEFAIGYLAKPFSTLAVAEALKAVRRLLGCNDLTSSAREAETPGWVPYIRQRNHVILH